tara:strand:+ start:177 stop:413 length:237 start_codon:yes stop_codon:yes gene_type:complete
MRLARPGSLRPAELRFGSPEGLRPHETVSRTPRLCVSPGSVTDDGEVTVAATEDFLRRYMAEFHAHVTRVLTVLPRED